MIGAMNAVAVRHVRRKKKTKDKKHRPKQLLLKPHVGQDGQTLSPGGSHVTSANPSRTGSPIHNLIGGVEALDDDEPPRYGDECFYGKVSLLQFIVFFFLGGLTVLIVGAVQFKKEAGLSYLRFHFVVTGAILIGVGLLLLVIKCACFRIALPEEYDDDDDFLSPAEKKLNNGDQNNSPNHVQEHQKPGDHNHHREPEVVEQMNKIETAVKTPPSNFNKKLNPV
jgi:hypothetical protein